MPHLVGSRIETAVNREIHDYDQSQLLQFVIAAGGTPLVIKFVASKWAAAYHSGAPLKISDKPALTWGTATYVTPLAFPLSSALYGRIGLVCEFDPTDWRIFDATRPAARAAYVRWVQAQPAFSDLVLTVHATHANHVMRNKFREDFEIDCVLFNPDQEAELHTDPAQDVWMAVTDWTPAKTIASDMSTRFADARFTVLLDEDFALEEAGLPIHRASRQIETTTATIANSAAIEVGSVRGTAGLAGEVRSYFQSGGYIHVFIKP